MRRSRRREEVVKGSKPRHSGGARSQKAGVWVLGRRLVVDHNRMGAAKVLASVRLEDDRGKLDDELA
jgi:hypothetical protein